MKSFLAHTGALHVRLLLLLLLLTACMNDPAVVLALYSLLVHSILAWVAYYGNNHLMQQAYSILVQSESSYYEITISSLRRFLHLLSL